ncbi:MAG: hypothetical protein ACYCZZ_01705 [Minisyncoccota bacterium]
MIKRIASALRTTPLVLALILSFGLSYAYASWTEPGSTPPAGNVDAPINTGATAQTKSGTLSAGTVSVPSGSVFSWTGTGNYLYGDSANTAIRQLGSFYVQNQVGAPSNVIANDYYIASIGKWASSLGGSGGGRSAGSLYSCPEAPSWRYNSGCVGQLQLNNSVCVGDKTYGARTNTACTYIGQVLIQ